MVERVEVDAVIDRHRASGRAFEAAGIGSFVLDRGAGEPVVLMHGLPASSFLYRKVTHELAGRGFRSVAFDLPGLGLAQRPPDADYTIAGLGAWTGAAVDALGLDRFHLVLHDAGGPIGLEMASRNSERILSLTILNTTIDIGSMPFAGEVYARLASRISERAFPPRLFAALMRRVGIADPTATTPADIDAYRVLALGDDQGSAYLEIMRSVRRPQDTPRWAAAVDTRRVPYSVRVAWGALDPVLPLRSQGMRLLAATGLPSMTVLPGKHFLQEDQAEAVAAIIAEHASAAGGGGR